MTVRICIILYCIRTAMCVYMRAFARRFFGRGWSFSISGALFKGVLIRVFFAKLS